MASIKRGLAIRMKGDEKSTEMKEDVADFVKLMKSEWTKKVSKIAHKCLQDRKMTKEVKTHIQTT